MATGMTTERLHKAKCDLALARTARKYLVANHSNWFHSAGNAVRAAGWNHILSDALLLLLNASYTLGEHVEALLAEVNRLTQPDPFAPASPAMLLADAMAERDAYRERVAKLEAALKPFALLADDNPQADGRVAIRLWRNEWNGIEAIPPTMADCRHARAVLLEPITPPAAAQPTGVEVLANFNPPVVILPPQPGVQG